MLRKFAKYLYGAVPFKRQLFLIVRALPIPEAAYRHLYFIGPIRIKLPDGRHFRMMHFGNQVENDLFWAGYGNGWERSSLRLWAVLAQRASCIIDIGANTGVYALAAGAINPSATVIAFEPVMRVHERLTVNASLNGGQVRTCCIALSDRQGTAILYDSNEAHVYSASLNGEMLGEAGHRGKSEVVVTTLDAFLDGAEIEGPALLKIDTEMHEPEVLAGAAGMIEVLKPTIIVEVLGEALGRRVRDQLPGYVFFEIVEFEGLRRATKIGGSGDRNYLALPGTDPRCVLIGDRINESQFSRLA